MVVSAPGSAANVGCARRALAGTGLRQQLAGVGQSAGETGVVTPRGADPEWYPCPSAESLARLLTKATALDDLAIRHLTMEFGASIFFTDYSITPAELGVALEERGGDSLWAAEHSHIPVPRRTPPPGGGELAKRYYDVMDPFVTLAVAAAVTRTLKVGTGVCLVIQRDTIQTAKLVASIDQVSGGRFLFGIGGGWNAEEIEAHGTVFATRMKKMREQIE